MNENPIFFDARGRRQKRAVRLGATAAAIAAATISVVFISVVFLLPFIPGLGANPVFLRRSHPPLLSSRGDELKQTAFLLAKARKELKDQIDAANRAKIRKASKAPVPAQVSAPPKPIVAAFYASWQETGLYSLEQNRKKLTHIIPEWLHLTNSGAGLDLRDYELQDNPKNQDVQTIARDNGIALYPILNNAIEGEFEHNHQVQHLLASPAAQQQLATTLTQWLLDHHCQGVNIDFESLSDSDFAKLPQFLSFLRSVLERNNLGLSVDVEIARVAYAEQIADASDFIVLMNYDEHEETTNAGPIASIAWFTNNITAALDKVPAEKLVVGIANYGYDWITNPKDQVADEPSVSYQAAVTTALQSRDDLPLAQRIVFDPDSLNSRYSYDDDNGSHHEVWLLDGPGAYNECKVVQEAGLRGTALWALGTEDPTVWNFMDKHAKHMPSVAKALENVAFPYEINFAGNGEILNVPVGFGQSKPGARIVHEDPSSGFCVEARYKIYPTPVEITRQGHDKARRNLIALTFDDGPDPKWTPQVLDALEQLKVPGTFFVIGENAVEHPGLVRREYNEGHEIGNHSFYHPNMGEVSDFRARLEIEATERAVQSITGRSTLLFRPPYNADAEPETAEDVKPVRIASELGYYTVGELIDPQDWNLYEPTTPGQFRMKTADEIANRIVQGVENGKGNVVLLHDAGGDRHLSVEALKIAVPILKAAGYHFVGVSSLIQMRGAHHPATRNDVMPEVSGKDLFLLPFERLAVYGWYGLTTFLTLAFLVAIGLGIGRIFVVTPLAIIGNRKRRLPPLFALGEEPRVSVIIAAFNEELVIVRTIQSVLASSYRNLEVIVVDDGSKDGTSDAVARAFARSTRVQAVRQENAGKAAALNHGMKISTGEIYVYLDADTIVASDAIAKLVAHFADAEVGAVAGNVKVGNRINMLTRLQALEYIASQNLDRRAYAHVNAITVVPGAIGAWRKTAIESAGGYTSDTLAEDMDLTWRVRLAGWTIRNESEAIAYTEAPATIKSFFKQRFRWTFGTLQCLFKHRRALGRNSWFGRVVLPALWVYQFALQVIAPFVDIQLFYSLVVFFGAYVTRNVLTRDWRPLPDAAQTMATIGFLYAVFFIIELVSAWIAFGMDRERKTLLFWLFLQRFVYRQVLYIVVWKALWQAARGARTGWGKFERKGTVEVSPYPFLEDEGPQESELEPVA